MYGYAPLPSVIPPVTTHLFTRCDSTPQPMYGYAPPPSVTPPVTLLFTQSVTQPPTYSISVVHQPPMYSIQQRTQPQTPNPPNILFKDGRTDSITFGYCVNFGHVEVTYWSKHPEIFF